MSQSRPTVWTIRIGLALTTLIAAFASYLHSLDVVRVADGHTLVAGFIPALADLVIATASANLLNASRLGQGWPPLAKVAVTVGILVTLGANIMATWPHAVPVWCVNVWPPVAFFLALEQLADHVRRGRSVNGEGNPEIVAGQPETPTEVVPEPSLPPRLTTDEALRSLVATGSIRGLAETLGVPKSRVETWRSRVSVFEPVSEAAPEEPVFHRMWSTDGTEVASNGDGPHE